MECLLFGTISGPCWDHVWPSFTFQLDTALKFSSLFQYGLRPMSGSLYFLGPYQDYVWTMFGLALLLDWIQLWNCQVSVNMVWCPCHGVFTFWDHIRAMFRPCLDHVWPSSNSGSAIALKFSRLNQFVQRPIYMECLRFGTISGPCWYHVWPGFIYTAARALEFLRVCHHGQ